LPEMLARVVGSIVPGREARAAGAWLWRLRAAVSTDLRARVSEKLPDGLVRELTTRLYLRGVEWQRTRAFAAPGDYRSFVRLNVRGRERDGIVPPAEADALLDEIVEGLTTFREPNGTPAIAAAERITARTAEGPGTAALPDLVVDWPATPAASLTGVTSPRFGDVVRRGLGSGRPGNHTDDAWVLVVPDRSRAQNGGRPPQITDVAATACAVVGVETDGLAGTPLLVPR
jgi:predicted AlkP superfamily phosphohydrolase/phosphomutase